MYDNADSLSTLTNDVTLLVSGFWLQTDPGFYIYGLPITLLGDPRALAFEVGSVTRRCHQAIIILPNLHCQTNQLPVEYFSADLAASWCFR